MTHTTIERAWMERAREEHKAAAARRTAEGGE